MPHCKSRFKYVVLLGFSFLLLAASPSGDPKGPRPPQLIRVGTSQQSCDQAFLLGSAKQLIDQPPKSGRGMVWWGGIKDLAQILQKPLGGEAQSALAVSELTQFADYFKNDPLMGGLVSFLKDKSESLSVAFCLTGPTCELKDDTLAISVSNTADWEFYFSGEPGSDATRQGQFSLPENTKLTEKVAQLVFFNYARLAKKTPQEAASIIASEVLKLSDIDFFNRWVRANKTLIDRGQSPDGLFLKWATYQASKDSKADVNAAFLRVFFESRDAHVLNLIRDYELTRYGSKLGIEQVSVIDHYYQNLFLSELSMLLGKDLAMSTVKALGLTPNNLWEHVLAWDTEMKATIRLVEDGDPRRN